MHIGIRTVHSICFVMILLFSPDSAFAGEMSSRTLIYKITSSQTTIGRIDTTEYYGEPKHISDSIILLNLNELNEDYTFQGRTKTQWDGTDITAFDHWIVEKGEKWHLNGTRVKDALWVAAYRVKDKKQKEMNELAGLALTITSYAIPHAGTAMQLLGLFASEESEGEESIPLDYYDTTDLDLPNYLLKQRPWKGTRKIKVFFTEKLERKSVEARFLGKQTVQSPAGGYDCAVFETKTDEMRSTTWLTEQPGWKFCLVKQKSTIQKHPYTVTLQSIK